MTTLRFDITLPDGSKESVETDAERVLIGRGAHCEVCLGITDLATEHVAVEILGDTVRLVARAFAPPPTLNSQEFSEVIVPQDAVLRIGELSVAITQVGVTKTSVTEKRPSSGSNAVRVIGVVALLCLLAVVALQVSDPVGKSPAAVPELWSKSETTCPAASAAQARALAAEKRIVADGKRERHPFYVLDGVEAVSLYELSATCFRKAGEDSLADEMVSTARQLRADVSHDYRVRRLRLERALATDDNEVAAREVIMLRTLVANKPGAYADWIHTLARKFEVDKEAS